MGQAFDRDGHVLGEAFGDTKREVFDKLIEQFKDAHKIEVRSLEERDSLTELQQLRRDLELAKSHNDNWARDYRSLAAKLDTADRLYHELIMCVGHKFPNESRHETALRYLRERETRPVLADARSAEGSDARPSRSDNHTDEIA